DTRRARGGRGRPHGRRLREPARLARDQPGARLRDLRRVRLGPRAQRLAAGRRGQRALPRLARAEPRAPLPRLPPLHGPARPLHAARGAASAGAARGAPRGRRRAGGGARAAGERPRRQRARSCRGGAPPAALRRRDPRLGRGAGDAPRHARRARPRRLDDRRADRRPRRGVPGARAPEAPHPPLRRAAPRAARDRGPGRPPRAGRRTGAGHRPLPHPRRAARDGAPARALGLALTATLAAGAAAALRTAAEQGWIAAGFYRLVVRTAWDRFDAWLPLAAAAALAGAGLATIVRHWRKRPARGGLRAALA